MPVVQRALIKRGSRFYVKLGEDEVEFNSQFKMYLHTKLSNPHYAPRSRPRRRSSTSLSRPRGSRISCSRSSCRRSARTSRSRRRCSQQNNQFKIQMIGLEDKILADLAAAEGDITEDKDLIIGLEEAKVTATDISKKMAAGVKTTEIINNTSEKYRPIARRGSQLFFVMSELSKIHTYYIYSSTRSSSSSSRASTPCR